MLHQKLFCFNIVKTFLLVFIIFLIFNIIYFVGFPHEAFCMDPSEFFNDNIPSDEDMSSDKDVQNRLIIAKKENYMSYNGNRTYFNREDLINSLYPIGLSLDYNIINDPYDNENYFNIPLTLTFAESKNVDLSPGIYSGCMSGGIGGLLIWPERFYLDTEFVKDYTQVIPSGSNISSVSLGARTINDQLVFVYIKCQDINKHKYFWTIWERSHLLRALSYKTFKKRWDCETNVWSNIDGNIRKDIIIELKDLLGIKQIDWTLRKSVRVEIVRFLRRTKAVTWD